jgi:hypothetical protein
MGEEAPGLARQLVEQLRNRHGLAAYTFDRGDAERQHDLEEHRKLEQAYGGIHLPFRHPRYTPQIAVLIGGYPDLDAANAALARVKKLPPPDIKLTTGEAAFDTEFGLRADQTKDGAEMIKRRVNPLERSFVARNPTVPQPKAEPVKFDPIWKELNAPESYSLLRNPKPWTLIVKEYVGASHLQNQSEKAGLMEVLGKMGIRPGEQIGAAGKQAHALAEFLRDKRLGFDAYVLHTRTSSIVTVGGFSAPDDPELLRVKRRLESLSFRPDPRSPAATSVQGDPVGLLTHPVPMEVPHF